MGMSYVIRQSHVLNNFQAVWKGVRAWSRRTLEKASEKVVDVQGEAGDGDEDEDNSNGAYN